MITHNSDGWFFKLPEKSSNIWLWMFESWYYPFLGYKMHRYKVFDVKIIKVNI
jgi:hypothetical protein